jgi:hypothetical protein
MSSLESITDIAAESELAVTLLRIRNGTHSVVPNKFSNYAEPSSLSSVSMTTFCPLPTISKASSTLEPVLYKSVQAPMDQNTIPNMSRSSAVSTIGYEMISFPHGKALHYKPPTTKSSTAKPCNLMDLEDSELIENGSEASIDDDFEDYNVRRDIIEAALLSQPQRGRKRDNLSLVERLELTRTRNREHAKSTRIRKKLRHQELIDKESQLRSILKKEEMNKRQCQRVLEYINLRQSTLQVLCRLDLSSRDEEQRSNVESNRRYRTIVEPLLSIDFRFEANGIVEKNETVSTAIASMHRFSGILADFVKNKVGGSCELMILSSNGSALSEVDVAINRSGVAIVQLCIAAMVGQRLTTVATLWTRVEFDLNTSRIKVIDENVSTDTLYDDIRNANLATQTSHPSVVSLDTSQTEHQNRDAINYNEGKN